MAATITADRQVARENELTAWFASLPMGGRAQLRAVAGDASFRRYFRSTAGAHSVVLCDAPPETEKNAEFLRIATAMAAAGVRVPRVLAFDLERGFLCLEDLGDQLLLPLLNEQSGEMYYRRAMAMLADLAMAPPAPFALSDYDRAHLAREMALFPEWFCGGLLGMDDGGEGAACFAALQEALCERALGQTQVVVHRDFHARNIMVLADGALAAIDFQDAVYGPVTYDLVSLLRDCYIRWPAHKVRHWALLHRDELRERGLVVSAKDHEFLADFDWMGLQRHIKVLGIFARLFLRDGKDAYLADLPRVIAHVRDVLAIYGEVPALADFARWFDNALLPRIREQHWYRS
ncbi:MAG: aminoglycoside/choline kinase family phosphotransferase [Halieaceae bacterium]|jgi:aminoglycoside/choline kinase family phosphotransferase